METAAAELKEMSGVTDEKLAEVAMEVALQLKSAEARAHAVLGVRQMRSSEALEVGVQSTSGERGQITRQNSAWSQNSRRSLPDPAQFVVALDKDDFVFEEIV